MRQDFRLLSIWWKLESGVGPQPLPALELQGVTWLPSGKHVGGSPPHCVARFTAHTSQVSSLRTNPVPRLRLRRVPLSTESPALTAAHSPLGAAAVLGSPVQPDLEYLLLTSVSLSILPASGRASAPPGSVCNPPTWLQILPFTLPKLSFCCRDSSNHGQVSVPY